MFKFQVSLTGDTIWNNRSSQAAVCLSMAQLDVAFLEMDIHFVEVAILDLGSIHKESLRGMWLS